MTGGGARVGKSREPGYHGNPNSMRSHSDHVWWCVVCLLLLIQIDETLARRRLKHLQKLQRTPVTSYLRTVDVRHQRNLIWAQQDQAGPGISRLVAISGDPSDWVPNHTGTTRSITAPNDRWRFVGLAFDYSRQTLYWSDVGSKKIQGISLNGTNVPFSVFDGISSGVESLALDWLAGNLYWTDSLYNWILVAPAVPDTVLFRIVVDTGLVEPKGITVHPYKGLLFWSDWSATPKIEKSDLTGNHRRHLVNDNLHKPLGLVLDYSTERLYWVDRALGAIESVDLLGGGRTRHFTIVDTQFFGMTLYQEYMFVTDQRSRELYVFNKDTGKHEVNFRLGNAQPYGIVMYDASLQTTDPQGSCARLGCEHICVSGYGGAARCLCASGYTLNVTGGTTCIDDGKYPTPMFIYSISNALCRFPGNLPDMSLDHVSLDTQCFLKDRHEALALTFNVHEHVLYFAENGTRTISRVRLVDGESPETIVGGTGTVEGMTLDWIASNMYWTDMTSRHVNVAKMDGRHQRALHTEGLDHPRGIVADAINRLLYWTDVGNPPRIERSRLDGTGRKTFISRDLGSPNHVIFDYRSNKLYWTDSLLARIESVFPDGTGRAVVFAQDGGEFYGLTVFQDFFVWTDRGVRHGLHVGVTRTAEKLRGIVHPGVGNASDVIAFAHSLQPMAKGPCDDPMECDQLCLPGSDPKTGTCACAMGFTRSEDDKSCVTNTWHDNFVLFADTYRKQIYQLNLQTEEFHALALSGHDNPIAIDYDPQQRMVYWTDVSAHVIKRAHISGHNEGIVRLLPPDSVADGIAVDAVSRLVVYTDTGRKLIGALDMRGRYHVTLISKGLDNPRAIAIDPTRGYIYWSDWGARSRIERATVAGRRRQVLVDTGEGHWPNGLTVDVTGGRLYWCNARSNTIESSDLTGRDRTLLHHAAPAHCFGVTSVGSTVYYTDWTKQTIMKLEKVSGQYITSAIGPPVFARANDITAYKSDSRGSGLHVNFCTTNNGGCEHLCLPVPGGRTCACADGTILQQDGLTCSGTHRTEADDTSRDHIPPPVHAAPPTVTSSTRAPWTYPWTPLPRRTPAPHIPTRPPATRPTSTQRRIPTRPTEAVTRPQTSPATTALSPTRPPPPPVIPLNTAPPSPPLTRPPPRHPSISPPAPSPPTPSSKPGQPASTYNKNYGNHIHGRHGNVSPPRRNWGGASPTLPDSGSDEYGPYPNYDKISEQPELTGTLYPWQPNLTKKKDDDRSSRDREKEGENRKDKKMPDPDFDESKGNNNSSTTDPRSDPESTIAAYLSLGGVLLVGVVVMVIVVACGISIYRKSKRSPPSARRLGSGGRPLPPVPHPSNDLPLQDAVPPPAPALAARRYSQLGDTYYTGEQFDEPGLENPAFRRDSGGTAAYEQIPTFDKRQHPHIQRSNGVPTFLTFNAPSQPLSDDGFSIATDEFDDSVYAQEGVIAHAPEPLSRDLYTLAHSGQRIPVSTHSHTHAQSPSQVYENPPSGHSAHAPYTYSQGGVGHVVDPSWVRDSPPDSGYCTQDTQDNSSGETGGGQSGYTPIDDTYAVIS